MNTVQNICDLADKRLSEAQLLLSKGFYEGAFYLAGYAVELRLKARVCKNLDIQDFYINPPRNARRDFKQTFFTHDLDQLLTLSGLRGTYERETAVDQGDNTTLSVNWQTICKWSEEKRYELAVTESDADDFLKAIIDPQNGFLTWLRQNW